MHAGCIWCTSRRGTVQYGRGLHTLVTQGGLAVFSGLSGGHLCASSAASQVSSQLGSLPSLAVCTALHQQFTGELNAERQELQIYTFTLDSCRVPLQYRGAVLVPADAHERA